MSLHYLSLMDVSERLRRGELTSKALTEALLDRIGRHDARLNSITLLLADSALEQARQADAEIASGFWRGPLHGVPIGIKDLLWTKGLPTRAGTEVLRDFRPTEDATLVRRLKQAGAVIIAKLHMTEGATLIHHPSLPRPANPWSEQHWTGVSSSGSGVAPAAGFCFGAIGSDTGGSIRLPSAANNLTGIKPTWGRVSRHGLIHLSESLDHLGPMARSVADAAAILQAIAGPDARDPTALPDPVPDYLAATRAPLGELVIGVDREFATADADREVVDVFNRAVDVLRDLGARVREVQFPWGDEEAGGMAMFAAQMALAHAETFPSRSEEYGPWLKATLHSAAGLSAADVARGHIVRDRFKGRIRAMFAEIDLLITPAMARLLPTLDEMAPMEAGEAPLDMRLMRFTSPFNLGGVPTLSLPGGFSAEGLPIGIQLAGGWLSEPALLRTGAAFQRATGFHTRHPDLEKAR